MSTPSVQNKIGFIVHFQFKPDALASVGDVGQRLSEEMVKEPSFVNYFQLQDETDPTKFVLYETWTDSKEEFMNVQMKRPFRKEWEEILPQVSTKPREMQMYWNLIKSEAKPVQENANQEKFGFFVYIHTKPGREQEYLAKVTYVLDEMSNESTFINYFLLQDERDPTTFVIYETWGGTKEEFSNVQMKHLYRRDYEESLPRLLAEPREVQLNWRLLLAEEK